MFMFIFVYLIISGVVASMYTLDHLKCNDITGKDLVKYTNYGFFWPFIILINIVLFIFDRLHHLQNKTIIKRI